MESSFGLLQNNVPDRRHWDTREELQIAIVTWSERTYHRRRQAALGRLTPIEFEAIMTTSPVTCRCSKPLYAPVLGELKLRLDTQQRSCQ